ncbi:MAG: hypothetical protein U0168_12110 [Nannocystaceae bacterium]
MSKTLVIAVVVPVVLVGAAVGGAFLYRDHREAAARKTAKDFLATLGSGGDADTLQRAFDLTDAAHHGSDSQRARQEFPEKLMRLGLLGGVQDADCSHIQRESNFINTFTMGLHGVECQWREGRGVLYVLASDGRELVVSANIDQRGHETL